MGTNPNAADNQWLRAAYENRIPVIYFLGIAPGRYQAIVPVYVAGWDAKALKARIVFGAPDQQELVAPQDVQERRYALRTVKQRLHQASFREAVISAYRGRCSLSGLPEKRLLDAAHIIPDANEQLGTARCAQWNTAVEDPPRRFRLLPDRHRSRLPRARFGPPS